MARNWITCLLLLLGLVAQAPAAMAQSYPDTGVRNWLVYSTPRYCWMMTQNADGTLLKYNWSSVEGASYIHVSSKSWNWVIDGELYVTDMAIGDWSSVAEFGGHELRPDGYYPISYFADDPKGFRGLVESGKTLRVKFDNGVAEEFSLAGSQAALAELSKCEKMLPETPSDD